MPNNFESQTNIAAFNVGFNILTQHRLVIFSDNQLSNFVNLKMACKKIVIMLTDQLKSNNLRHVEKTPILEHFLNIFLALKKLYSSQLSCLFVVALQI